MKYLSLFTGIGGFELGIKQAYEELYNRLQSGQDREENNSPHKKGTGGEHITSEFGERKQYRPVCIGYSEIDKYAIQTYEKHFNHKNYGDITKINEKELPDFDLLVGGFPCQSFSIAGNRGGFEDTRGTLFFDIARIVREKQPRLLLLENVKGLLSHDKGNTFTTIISTLDELGYDCQWQVLNSKNFGVPQNRERVFIIGHLRGTSRPEVFPITEVNCEDIILPTITTRVTADSNGSYVRKKQTHKIKMRGGLQKNAAEMINRSPALTEAMGKGGGHTPIVSGIRRLTPKECERLQGFPDDWTKEGTEGKISDTQRYKMCGNAVTVNVIKEIMKKLI